MKKNPKEYLYLHTSLWAVHGVITILLAILLALAGDFINEALDEFTDEIEFPGADLYIALFKTTVDYADVILWYGIVTIFIPMFFHFYSNPMTKSLMLVYLFTHVPVTIYIIYEICVSPVVTDEGLKHVVFIIISTLITLVPCLALSGLFVVKRDRLFADFKLSINAEGEQKI